MVSDRALRARASPTEVKALRLLAAREGIKATDKLRELVRDAAKDAGLWPPKVDAQTV